jgi:hypothetical protein
MDEMVARNHDCHVFASHGEKAAVAAVDGRLLYLHNQLAETVHIIP